MDLISIVIPCFNPGAWLLEAVASARSQTYPRIEIVLINDGTHRLESQSYLEKASGMADSYLEQENRGLPAARNAGFRAARGRYVVPLDADDVLRPNYVAECIAVMNANAHAAFVYTDCSVFGSQEYVDRLPEYNLYTLLDRNFLTYAALIRKDDWEQAGGYDESMQLGYEDWEFWLRLGARGRFGLHIPKPLFCYRRAAPSLYDKALAHHSEIVKYIQCRHPELFEYAARARLKAHWRPAVCIVGNCDAQSQTIEDLQILGAEDSLLERSPATAFVLAGAQADSQTAEMAALAVWSGNNSFRLPDGSLALSRRIVRQHLGKAGDAYLEAHAPVRSPRRTWLVRGELHRHLLNAQLLDWKAWLRHPWRCLLRLIPLRLKERINQAAGRPLFDLSFYLQFQPRSVLLENKLVQPLVYFPKPSSKPRRIALVTPHLGPGGAENVLMEIVGSLSRDRFEILLLATQSSDDRWLSRWRERVEHIYDLAKAVSPGAMSAAVHSMVCNWNCDTVLVQNSLFGYAALQRIKNDCLQIRTLDLLHSIDPGWDLIACTKGVEAAIDLRVAVSGSVRERLLASGTPDSKVRLIRNIVDLDRFQPSPPHKDAAVKLILFAGRLDPVKRPLMLVRIAIEVAALRKARDFRFVVVGDGSEMGLLRESVRREGTETLFEFRGYVEDMAPLFAASDVVVLTSKSEGIPLVILEAFASSRPVVASNVGAVAELLDANCGVLIEVTSHDSSDFAVAIDNLLNRPELRERMGAMGRKKVEEHFNRRQCLEAYARLFE